MSKYTTEVRFICENKAGREVSGGFSEVDNILSASWNKIFTGNVPFFDESYRAPICQKILKHYYLREIGFETVGVWLLKMNTKLAEVMPYYNELYKSTMLEFNPLFDTDITTARDVKGSGNENTTNDRTIESTMTDDRTQIENRNTTDTRTDNLTRTNNGTNLDLYHDTPQGQITQLDDNTYLSNARKITDNGTENSTGTQEMKSTGDVTVDNTGTQKNDTVDNDKGTRQYSSTEDYVEHITGKRGGQSYSKMLMEFRQALINVDLMLIEEFEPCFMQLW